MLTAIVSPLIESEASETELKIVFLLCFAAILCFMLAIFVDINFPEAALYFA